MDDSNDPNPSTDVAGRNGSGLPESTFGQDTLFEALAHERRRYLLYTLLEDEAWSLLELARKLAAWEAGVSDAEVDETMVERVYVSLYHAHVPKLDDLEIIEFDRETETISKGNNAEQVLTVLELTGGSDAVDLENQARSNQDD